MNGFVYILEDLSHRYYIGSCANVEKRLKRHLSGLVYTTRRMKEPKLVFHQHYQTMNEAKTIERKLKKLKRKDYIAKIIRDGVIKMKP
ncbi:MAG: hypothetical protein A3J48_01045 [Candidatus Doudnabacteria bacterium RIFCSPHIGHO2_02_FULL_46_11]|uniref:GIY-YIG domain-containing protein n=1 Tax=Candidatus Doudnabacteria bacterium RIFCSPHIGHO2_02_FULL_46_11 TaxID=1817832 RepID=A0A1F5P7I5_9BACT|nr:MAG: hypothetical protein A3J48_01045 [Candidatus Doudnabacteria bacterium RIFCSPHIGHO2_02_FULL_46_11]